MRSDSAVAGPGHGQPRPPSAVVIVGEEDLLVERAIRGVLTAAGPGPSGPPGGASGDVAVAEPDVHDVRAADLAPGELAGLTAPSLFGGGSVVVVRSVQDAGKEVSAELVRLSGARTPDVVLVMTHSGGAKNKSLLTSLAAQGVQRIDCPVVRRFGERLDFLRAEFGRAGRRADDSGLRALLDAVGTDLRELASACDQLAADTTGVISQSTVTRYYRGRAEASGFTVADRAFEGKLADSLEQLRWALSTGVSPVLISSALAQGVRALGRVGTAGGSGGSSPRAGTAGGSGGSSPRAGTAPRGRGGEALAAQLGMPPWKIDKVRRQLRGWTPEGVARAHGAVAEADAQVKGEGVSAGYALERAIRTIVSCRAPG